MSAAQARYLRSRSRYILAACGRRSLKTEGAKRREVLRAIRFSAHPDGRWWFCAPTQAQAERIFWEDLKALVPAHWLAPGRSVRENDRQIRLVNGTWLIVAGLDAPERLEGLPWDGGVVTEMGKTKPDALTKTIRPMMTRGGSITIEGVPKGRNHYYDLYCAFRDSQEARLRGEPSAAWPGAEVHEWRTDEVLHLYLGREAAEAELAAARGSMDLLTYEQEYGGAFVSFEGRAYYAWDRALNLPPHGVRVDYMPDEPLILALDFNVAPGVAAYLQEQPVEGLPWVARPQRRGRRHTVTAAIGEVHIRRGSNTRKVCQRVIDDWGERHRGDVLLYGDAAGGAKVTSGVAGTDWEIVRAMLRPVFGHRLKDRVGRSNPPVRARVNAVNSRLVSVDGAVGMVADPGRCPRLVDDFEGVEVDDDGGVKKAKGDPLSHLSDAVGYYLEDRFPCQAGSTSTMTHG